VTGMSTIALGEIMASRSGSVDPSKYPDEIFELYSIPAFDTGMPELMPGRAIGSAKQVVEPGDVLLSRIVPHIRRSWVVQNTNGRRIIASGEWIVFRSDRIHPAYLQHVLVGDPFHLQFMRTVSGVGGSLLRARPAYVARIEIPLPSVAEQQRIAEILDRAEELRRKRRAAFAQIDTLTQSIFLDVFGDAGDNPKGWPVQPVSSYVAEFQGGKSLEAESGANAATTNRVLKVSAVTGMEFLPSESKPVPDSYQPPPEHFTKPGDLLFSRANTTELVGAVAYVESTPNNLLLPDKLWRFVWRQPKTVEALFVWALFQTATVRGEIARRATGTSGSMKNISQEKVFGIKTIVPPLSLQRDFVRRIAALKSLKTVSGVSLAELDALFASLQYRAFRGEL
jgi:type I restriction enzyme S subunit